MPATNALLGYGSSFSIQTENSPDVYLELEEVLSITPPSSTVDQIDATHMQSPDRRREFISGLIDSGEMSLEMHFIPGSNSDDRLRELLAIPAGQSRRRNLKIVFPNHVTSVFLGELQTYEPTVPFDDKMIATVSFKVTGAETLSIT